MGTPTRMTNLLPVMGLGMAFDACVKAVRTCGVRGDCGNSYLSEAGPAVHEQFAS